MARSRSICNLSSVSLVSILLMKLNQTPRVLQLECKKVCADCMQKAMKSKVSSKSLIFQTVSPNFVYKVTETYSTIFFQFYLLSSLFPLFKKSCYNFPSAYMKRYEIFKLHLPGKVSYLFATFSLRK